MAIDTAAKRNAALLDQVTLFPDSTIDRTDRANLLGQYNAGRATVEPAELLWFHNLLDDQVVTIHNLLTFEIDDRHQDSEIVRFTIAADDPKQGYAAIDTLVRYKTRYWRITHRDPQRDGTRTVIACEAEARWVELGGVKRVGSTLLLNVTPLAGLTWFLAGTGWTVGSCVDAASDYSIDKTDASVLELVRAWALITGTEVVFDTAAKTVSLVASQGVARDLGFRYGWNLKGITRRETPPAVTRLYPYGRNGLTIEGINPTGEQFIEDFSYYTDQGLTEDEARARYTRSDVWKDDSFVSDVPLYFAAVVRLAQLARPTIAYESSVVDLQEAIGQEIPLELGDTVPVVDGPLGIDVRARIVRRVRRPLVPAGDEVELAYLQGRPLSDSSADTRFDDRAEWLLFLGDSAADRSVDTNLQILGDIGLQFVQGGDAVHHLDAVGTATGSGTLRVTFYDENGNQTIGPVIDVPFTAGPVHVSSAFGLSDLQGNYLFSVRAVVVSGTGHVDFVAGASKYSILARGGLGVTVQPDQNSITFNYNGTDGSNGSAQTWDVPAGVTSVVIDSYGAQGGDGFASSDEPGRGGRIRARLPVTAGETLTVQVGGQPSTATGGYNGGGDGSVNTTTDGAGGGGGSDVRRGAATLADRLIVAPGGGGSGSFGLSPPDDPGLRGGAGGYPAGEDGYYLGAQSAEAGDGATSSAAGAGGIGGVDNGNVGGLGVGGDAGDYGSATLGAGSGGGGGGLYGGGGGGLQLTGGRGAGGGGGSAGVPAVGATEILAESGVQFGHGKVVISWDTPT